MMNSVYVFKKGLINLGFETVILIITFIVSIILGTIIIPILKKLKVGQIERDDGPQSHLKKQGTPTMGGIIIIITMIIMVTCVDLFLMWNNQSEIAAKLIPILLLTIGFGLIGFIDDFKKLVLKNTDGLKPLYKMLGLLVISVGYVIYLVYILQNGTNTYIPFAKQMISIPLFLYIPCLTIIGILSQTEEIGIFGSIMIGAVLGFLMFNLHPAKVFMGDTGSLLLGGVISAMALYLKMPLLLLIIALIPVLETLSVIIQVVYFKKTGNRIFKMAPLHHHFELSGWKESRVVMIFSLVTLILCIIGLISV